ncbi:DUF1569 domain-containing protein [Mesonia ostreae]|uniref:DUF1569 domain-containing protein n=1 Tax=Mesonia ostreae TaxID=861110 RepID=A0ABU2KLN5_9FLAO|nr:DUF1569 domain-containing protein [Mesonia ostreae]MDT0295539.1 DUF1569 domain-containing protein [Mesonia ostreae]
MKSLFNSETYLEINRRLETISKNSNRKWGKMQVAQMLHHCQKPLSIALEKEQIEKPPFYMRVLAKFIKSSMYNDKAWKQNLPTAKELKITSPKNFDVEKENLFRLIKEFHVKNSQEQWTPHPIFGSFTKDQWGKMQYKHLDHHFRQFGI